MWLNCRILLGNVDRSAESDTVMWTALQNLTQLQEQSAESDTVMWEICRKWQTALQILTRHSYKSNQQNLMQLFGKSAENDNSIAESDTVMRAIWRIWHSYVSDTVMWAFYWIWHSIFYIIAESDTAICEIYWIWQTALQNLTQLCGQCVESDTVHCIKSPSNSDEDNGGAEPNVLVAGKFLPPRSSFMRPSI
jgi:hypothetical protein